MMTLGHHCQQALLNLNAAKLRSLLAVLGILMGTAAVVALMGCGQLATEKALEQFKVLGTDLLSITVFERNTVAGAQSGQNNISLRQWRQLPLQNHDVLAIAPYSTAAQTVSFRGRMIKAAVIGADESLADIMHIIVIRGHFVSFVDSFEHFCVIGHAVADAIKMSTLDDPIGQQIRIGNVLYTIIGEAAPWKENGFFNENVNLSVMIPIAGMGLVSKDYHINNAVLRLKQDIDIDKTIQTIEKKLNATAPKLTVYVRSAKQIINSMESQGHIFTLLLGVIGGISLLVGGIGIMNVMLVSVSERKKEIGIRKAVGAKNAEIRTLFLVESVMLSLFGGILGVVVGLTFTAIVAYFSHWAFAIHWMPPLAGFAVSVSTGIFFGFYPASRAAKLEPMESLRNE